MKRQLIQIIVMAILPLFVSAGLFAQVQCYQHEFSVYGGGGLSGLNYKPTFGDRNLGFGGHFGLGYHYFFSPKWALGTGAELGFYRSKFKMDDLKFQFETTDFQGIDFQFRSTVNDFEEKQRAMLLQIPLMLQHQSDMPDSKYQFFGALGVKAGFSLREKYKNTGTFHNAGYYAFENALYDTQQFMGFGEFRDRKSEGNLDFKTAFFLAAEAGLKWKLNEKWSLYTGLYLDYGLNNVQKTQNLSSRPDLITYNKDNPAGFVTNSIIQSKYTPQGTNTTTQAFTDKVKPIAAGIKVRLAFGKPCKQKEIQPPLPAPLPPPANCDSIQKALDDALKALEECEKARKAAEDALKECQDELDDCKNKPEPEPEHVAIVYGKVLDDVTKDPIGGAKIEIIDNDTHEVMQVLASDSQTGDYKVILPAGKNYGMTVTAPDYLFHSENFSIPDASGRQEIRKDVLLHKLEAGKKIVLKNIFFDFDRATLQPTSYPELANVVKLMNEYPTLVIEISGHTDNRGAAAYNQTLSQNRAKAVVDYLAGQGIPVSRLKYAGYGLTQPIADNSTDEGRATNRRVEFKILEI